ncbi:MAG: hypothetical protein JSV80_14945 [Acidobacteriota bacterium]|nr:MAG: hypothetical protein JSV80_14945 [Acidobacteriota bacterium]
MTPFGGSPSNPLTPSEVVFLHGDEFARKATLGKLPLLHTETTVSAAELGRTILLTAFLAAEQAGEVTFETREERKLLGLRRVETLLAMPAAVAGSWPEQSLEAAFSKLTRQLADQGKNDVRTIVYEWLGEDSGVPWREVVEKLKGAMAARGLLEARKEKKMRVFSVTHYSLPEATAALRQQITLEPVRKLIEDCRQGRPRVFRLLETQLNKAIRARTDQDAAG